MCIDPHRTGFVGKGIATISSSLNFVRPAPPGSGSAAGQTFLAPPYYSQRAVFASPLSAFFTVSRELITVNVKHSM